MTRLGFFVFNALFIVLIYGGIYLTGSKPGAISYAIREISEPYIALLLLMTIFTTLRWFMAHDEEVGAEIKTWISALAFVPIATLLAIYLVGGIQGGFWQGLKGLMTLR